MATDTPKFWWFTRESAVALALRILTTVLCGTFNRLEAIPYEKDGLPALRFRVVTDGNEARSHEDGHDDINDSKPCPPICPD